MNTKNNLERKRIKILNITTNPFLTLGSYYTLIQEEPSNLASYKTFFRLEDDEGITQSVHLNKGDYEVVSSNLLEEARRKYPVGTRFVTFGTKETVEVIADDHKHHPGYPDTIQVTAKFPGGKVEIPAVMGAGQWAEIVPAEKAETNLEKAKRLYKPGVTFRSVPAGIIDTVKLNPRFREYSNGCITVTATVGERVVFSTTGVWSEILTTPQDPESTPQTPNPASNLEKAKKRYPPGTRVYSIISKETFVVSDSSGIRIYGQDIIFNGAGDSWYLYKGDRDQWAEIVETTQEEDLLAIAKAKYLPGTKWKSLTTNEIWTVPHYPAFRIAPSGSLLVDDKESFSSSRIVYQAHSKTWASPADDHTGIITVTSNPVTVSIPPQTDGAESYKQTPVIVKTSKKRKPQILTVNI